MTPTQEAVAASAVAYQQQQAAAREQMLANVLTLWALMNMKDVLPSWSSGIGERIYVLVSVLQELVARDSNLFVRRILGQQGLDYLGGDIDPLRFAGIASDGRDLESLLAGAAIRARAAVGAGLGEAEAARRGEQYLRLVINTQIADAGRAAEQVSLIAAGPEEPTRTKVGWIRLLTLPSCGRCAVLAGKFYRWSDGFERHPQCDCHHVPVTEEVADGLTTNPYEYFKSLSEEDQAKYFGKANSEAIRAGADINQVVNSARTKGSMVISGDGRRYTTEGARRATRSATRVLRPTPWQIIRDANGDLEVARAGLLRFRYILS